VAVLTAMVHLAAACLLAGGCAAAPRQPSVAAELEAADPGRLSEANQSLARGCLSAVEIHGHRLITIQETVESVFTAAGLAVHRRSTDEMVFERPATRGERGAYGTWFGEDVRVRLRVDFQLQNHGVYLLRCRCFIARDAGTHAEDEQSLARRRVRKYAGLLDQVSKRLN